MIPLLPQAFSDPCCCLAYVVRETPGCQPIPLPCFCVLRACFFYSVSTFLLRTQDNTLRMWDMRPFAPANRCTKVFTGHQHNFEQNLLKCDWSPDGSRVRGLSAGQVMQALGLVGAKQNLLKCDRRQTAPGCAASAQAKQCSNVADAPCPKS